MLLNKRGKPKKPSKEGPPLSASATTFGPSFEPTMKKTAVKKMRAKKITSTSAARAPTIGASATSAPVSVVLIPPPEMLTTTECPLMDIVGGSARTVSRVLPSPRKIVHVTSETSFGYLPDTIAPVDISEVSGAKHKADKGKDPMEEPSKKARVPEDRR